MSRNILQTTGAIITSLAMVTSLSSCLARPTMVSETGASTTLIERTTWFIYDEENKRVYNNLYHILKDVCEVDKETLKSDEVSTIIEIITSYYGITPLYCRIKNIPSKHVTSIL